jgi:hypothetical protein
MTRISHPAKLARQADYWRRRGRPDVVEAIETALAASGYCKRCGRLLTATESIEAGVGPECRRKDPDL